jgi:hypothetical protein
MATMIQINFLPPESITIVSGKDSQNKVQEASPKSAIMKTEPSAPTSKLSVGLQNIKYTNKLSRVVS